MGEIGTEGPQALEFLQRLLSNDVAKLEIGGAQYSCLCAEDGGILDDLFTYRLAEDRFLTVTNAANHEADMAHFLEVAVDFEVSSATRGRVRDARRPGAEGARDRHRRLPAGPSCRRG